MPQPSPSRVRIERAEPHSDHAGRRVLHCWHASNMPKTSIRGSFHLYQIDLDSATSPSSINFDNVSSFPGRVPTELQMVGSDFLYPTGEPSTPRMGAAERRRTFYGAAVWEVLMGLMSVSLAGAAGETAPVSVT